MKKKFQIKGMHCISCAMTVDGAVEDLAGVKSASTNYARQFSEVEYDEKKVTDVQIIAVIEAAGYKAAVTDGK